jgi:hypothetical protein
MMSFFEWLESSALAEWVAASLMGYPIMITTHAVGLGIVVGVTSMLSLRLLGMFKGIALEPFLGFFLFTWIAFFINFCSGVALFTSQATFFVTHPMFLIKMSAMVLNAVLLGYMQIQMKKQVAIGSDIVTSNLKICAFFCLTFWSVGIIAGRLIAYI